MTDSRDFDLVIFGATGFTGFFVVRDLVQSLDAKPDEYAKLKWAVAGRNSNKLNEVLNKVSNELNKPDLASTVEKIVADVSKPETLLSMAKRTRLLVNCVGPYRFYGRPVVEACVEAGTHHIDISGEPQYIETMQVDYNQKALDNGTLVISTCGWDSIPCDLGVDFLKRNFLNGKLHSVETFMQTQSGPQGYKINFGTLQSAIYGFAHGNELRKIRQELYGKVFKKKLPKSRIRLDRKQIPFTRPEINGYNMEFPGSDRSVVQRTQQYNYEHFDEYPTQIQTYFTVKSIPLMFGTILLAAVFALLSSFKFGRNLLENYPEVFTFGVFSKKGPTREQIDKTSFSMRILGKGWALETEEEKTSDSEPVKDFDKKMSVMVSGPDPGYRATSACLIQSGLTILMEREKMPKGGVMTPASAFRNTSLLDRLKSRDVKFEIISN